MNASLISIHPVDNLLFDSEKCATLTLLNPLPEPITFKIKTNAPKLYNVSPNSGTIEPNQSFSVSIKLKEGDEEEKGKKHKFQIVANARDGRQQSAVLGVAVGEREETLARFVTSVFQDEPVEDIEKTKSNMQELQEQSLKMTKDIDKTKLEISKIEHQLRFRGESKLQYVDTSAGYSIYHLVLGFLLGVLIAAIIR